MKPSHIGTLDQSLYNGPILSHGVLFPCCFTFHRDESTKSIVYTMALYTTKTSASTTTHCFVVPAGLRSSCLRKVRSQARCGSSVTARQLQRLVVVRAAAEEKGEWAL